MTDKLKQTIEKEVGELPKEMQDAIKALDWVKVCEDISKAHNLDEDEINNFQLETLLALTGITDLEFYATNIENQVELTKSDAENIAKEALNKIFAPIRTKIEENVKNNLGDKAPSWEQSMNFVLSGGDYTKFLGKSRDKNKI